MKTNKPIKWFTRSRQGTQSTRNARKIAKVWRDGYHVWYLATNEYSNHNRQSQYSEKRNHGNKIVICQSQYSETRTHGNKTVICQSQYSEKRNHGNKNVICHTARKRTMETRLSFANHNTTRKELISHRNSANDSNRLNNMTYPN